MKFQFLVFLVSFFLSGCHPYCYRAYPYSLNKLPIETPLSEAQEAQSIIATTTQEPWWNFFSDPQLGELILLGLQYHPTLQVADARIRLACEQARVTRSTLFPHIYGMADVKREKISRFGEGFVPGFPTVFTETTLQLSSILYELDIWQKNRSLFYAALDRVEAEKADFEEAQLLLSTTIAAFYFDLQLNLARQKITKERLEARKDLYSLLLQQFELGIIPEFRLYEVDSDVQLLTDFVLQLKGEIEIDRHALAALIYHPAQMAGEILPCMIEPSAHFDSPFPLPSSLPSDFLLRRPDVSACKWLIEAACYDVKAAKANFFPRIDLLSWLGFQSIEIAKLFTLPALIAAGEAHATLPLFTAGKLQGELGITREQVEIAIENYNLAVLNAVQELSDALTLLKTADERKKSLEKAVADAEKLYHLIKDKYEEGLSNKLALLAALENVLLQKDLKAVVQLERFEAAVRLIRSIGGGYCE